MSGAADTVLLSADRAAPALPAAPASPAAPALPAAPASPAAPALPGETNLRKLIASMQPELDAAEFVFCEANLPPSAGRSAAETASWAVIREEEGITLILKKEDAETLGLPYTAVFGKITLMVHSSLEAVGLTAAVAAKLAELGICANVVAGYRHDHIFVPAHRSHDALCGLQELSRTFRRDG